MKKFFLLTVLLISCSFLHSQILKKMTDKVKQKTDKSIDDAMNGKKDGKNEAGVVDDLVVPREKHEIRGEEEQAENRGESMAGEKFPRETLSLEAENDSSD